MYEKFGAIADRSTRDVTFGLFVPDASMAPSQYGGGGLPRIRKASVVGSFQRPATREWDVDNGVLLNPTAFCDPPSGPRKGLVYTATVSGLPDGFFEYKYKIEFENGEVRLITDPCARYGGAEHQNAGFVVRDPYPDARDEQVIPLQSRKPLSELIIYEVMIDDFTAKRTNPAKAPLEEVTDRLDELVKLGVNAVELMPVAAWAYSAVPNDDFSWGYNPVQYFAIAHKYTLDGQRETNRTVYLRKLVNACHERGIHVILDGVFNHADAASPGCGFPYYWLYEDPADSPYVGNFAEAAFFKDLDYANQCTLEYIRDACIYWIDTFKIDGIRFDNTAGMYRAGDRACGIPKLLSELRGHLSKTENRGFATIIEHEWNYGSVDVTNKIGATSCWLDPYRSKSMGFLGDRPNGIPQIEPSIMRMLDSGRDFMQDRVPTIYIENHDHRRFMLKAGGRKYWYLSQPYVIALFTCAGAPLIYNAQEYGADNDMPETGDGRVVPRPIDWQGLTGSAEGQATYRLYQKMIQIRRDYPSLGTGGFYPGGWGEGWRKPNPQGFGVDCDRNIVVYHRWNDRGQGKLERFYIVLNFSGQDQDVSFEVPADGPWMELLGGPDAMRQADGRLHVRVGSNWGAIYYRND